MRYNIILGYGGGFCQDMYIFPLKLTILKSE
uniref:Uncharacterized protein n=1 Tax=Arundo donax TaxID=35708 RepID=A0A0A9GGK1_ARUDO